MKRVILLAAVILAGCQSQAEIKTALKAELQAEMNNHLEAKVKAALIDKSTEQSTGDVTGLGNVTINGSSIALTLVVFALLFFMAWKHQHKPKKVVAANKDTKIRAIQDGEEVLVKTEDCP